MTFRERPVWERGHKGKRGDSTRDWGNGGAYGSIFAGAVQDVLGIGVCGRFSLRCLGIGMSIGCK